MSQQNTTVFQKPSAFPFRWIPDDQLPEGRLAIPFSVSFLPNQAPETVNIGGQQVLGALYTLDPASLNLSIQGLSGFKALQLSIDWSAYPLGTSNAGSIGQFYVYVPTSGQIIKFGYPSYGPYSSVTTYPADLITNVCVPLIAGPGTPVQLFKASDTITSTIGLPIVGVATNFELPTYGIG